MSDSMKFGPEWLRNMSNDIGHLSSGSSATAIGSSGGGGTAGLHYSNNNNSNNNNNNNSSRFPQAEFRYGREEMLSLHDKNFKLPELLPKYHKLFIEKMQCPLALLPPTSDEEVPRGLSTIAALSSERGGGLGLSATSSSSGLMGSISSSLSGMSGRGTRGSSIDRGRGRARGLYHSTLGNYQRSALYDEENRTLTGRIDRVWPERNGTTPTDADWNSSSAINPSPRKEFSSLRTNASGESWRRSRIEDDELGTNVNGEGWRTSGGSNSMYKWPTRSTSWRGGEGEGGTAFNSDLTGPSPGRLERSKSSNSGLGSTNRDHDSAASNLSRRFGAGSNNTSWDDDNLPEWAMDEPIEGGGSFDASGAFLGCDDKHMRGHYDGSNEDDHHQSEKTRRHERDDSPSETNEDEHGDDRIRCTNSDDGNARHSLDENDKTKSDAPNFSTSKEAPNEKSKRTNESGGGGVGDIGSADQKSDTALPLVSPSTAEASSGSSFVVGHNDRMREVADDIEKLIMDDDLSCSENVALQSDSKAHKTSTDESIAEKVGENALGGATGASELSDLWYYRDPQGKVQGPFTATEMLEWYRAGYFDENLYVKRVCDPQFMALGELLKLCSGTIPFVAAPAPYMPQLLPANKGNDISVVPASASTKPVANHISHASLPAQLTQNPPALENPMLNESNRFRIDLQNASQLGNDMQNASQLLHFVGSQNGSPQKFPQLEQPHLLNQQPMTIKSLAETEPWALLNPEQQATLMAMNNAQPISKERNKTPILLKKRNKTDRFIDHSQYGIQLRGTDDRLVDERAAEDRRQVPVPVPVNMIHPPPDSVQHMLHTISMQNQSQIPPVVENNPIKSLIMQLSMPKSAPPPNMLPAHHHLQQPSHMQLPHDNRMPPIPQAHNVHGLWEIPLPSSVASNLHGNLIPNAAHILEQHMHAKAKEAHQLDQWKKQQQQQLQTPMIHHELQQSMPNELIQQTEMFKIRNENFKEEHIATEPSKPVIIEKTNANNPTPDAKIDHNQSSVVANESDLRNNNAIVAKKVLEKLIPDDESDNLIDSKSNKLNKNVPSTAATAKQAPIESKQNQKVALNNNNTQQLQQQQNGIHDSGHSISANTSIHNNSKGNAIAAVGPTAGGKTAATTKESSTKKKNKDKDQRLAEEKKRQLDEEERQLLEEKKRLELIAAQRKAKLVDQTAATVSRGDANGKRNNVAASIAPWSNIGDVGATNVVTSPLNFAEIQKAERERRAESYRMEQSLREQQTQAILEQQQQKDAVLKWKLKPQANQTKSLTEIQAEESKARQSNIQQVSTTSVHMKLQHVKKDEKWSSASQWAMRADFSWGESVANVTSGNGNMILPAANGNPNYFWEEASKPAQVPTSIKHQNQNDREMRSSSIMQQSSAVPTGSSSNSKNAQSMKPTALSKTNSTGNVPSANMSTNNAGNAAKKAKAPPPKRSSNNQNEDSNNDDFHIWCTKTLSAKHGDVIDVPTFVSFLRDIESPFEVKDYIRMYLGETKECVEFAKNFLERRSRYKNQQRAANAHIDDMCSPAPAITPAADGQETKGKGKKEKKKNKMMKLDSRILGFSVTSAEDRLNVGARERDGP